MTSTLPPLLQAVSGALGSASSNALTYPLDLATTRIQLQKPTRNKQYNSASIVQGFRILQHIIRRDGLPSLYSGLSTDTSATLMSNFFYFYLYSFLRNFACKWKNSKSLSMGTELLLGFLAGVSSRAVSNPLNLITLRLQLAKDEEDGDEESGDTKHPPATTTSVVQRIYQEEGLLGFWRGFGTTILLSINPSITLALFQIFLRLRHSQSLKPTPRQAFLGGAISNSIAIVLLYPLILAKTRLQGDKARRKATLFTVLNEAYTSDTLYHGLGMQITKGFLSQGVTFLVKERIEQFVVNLYLKRQHR
ncbi:mitochondrial carrier [Cylindrobasidium torrendii FP15055 ss-10]|uniref:Mitochondrial carrier n=1 Tax=Cylindrobasidium torrendii FP15055 ss-10 TaxID=1314674 RepID=A0A0D7B6L6_9AGAR|nr:mitochondrial carrier [Cylindrobasidium torrendii FP15055 ss-10]